MKRFWKKFAHSKFASFVQQFNRISGKWNRISGRIPDIKKARYPASRISGTTLEDRSKETLKKKHRKCFFLEDISMLYLLPFSLESLILKGFLKGFYGKFNLFFLLTNAGSLKTKSDYYILVKKNKVLPPRTQKKIKSDKTQENRWIFFFVFLIRFFYQPAFI